MLEIKDKVLLRFRKSCVSKDVIKTLLPFSFNVAITVVVQWLLLGFTQIIIDAKLGSASGGQFNVVYKFSSIIILLANTIQFAWYELAYSVANDENSNDFYKSFVGVFINLLIIFFPLIIIAIKLIYPFFIGPEYQVSSLLIPPFLLGTVISCFAGFLNTVFLAKNESRATILPYLLSGVVNFGLQILLIEKVGLIGSVIIYTASNLILVIIQLIRLKSKANITVKISVPHVLILIAICVLYYYIRNLFLLVAAVIDVALIILLNLKTIKNTLRKIKSSRKET